jgi:1-acyl-sn-glycerol-3-phosphate acyltransferase
MAPDEEHAQSNHGRGHALLGTPQLVQRFADTFAARWLMAAANRWTRRSIIASFAVGFSIPYFRLLNHVQAAGDALLETLPRSNVIFLANHQTYFLEAIAFFDLVYLRHGLPLEHPVLRFSAAEETMKMNPLTMLMRMAGGVTLRRRFRDRGHEVNRPVDLEGVARIQEAIRTGWLLHFPAGTTREGAPIRSGIARILHDTRPVAVPVRVDGFRRMLLLRQVPGKLFRSCSIHIQPPLDLQAFYDAPLTKESSADLIARLERKLGASGPPVVPRSS